MNSIRNATRKKIVYEDVKISWSREITSLEEFNKLPHGTDVTIMLNATMILGKVEEWFGSKCVNVGTRSVPINDERFQYRNSMHEVTIVKE